MVYRECRNTVNHKIVPDEPLGSLTGLAPIRNALFPPFLPSWRPEITFRVRDRGWKSVFYVIPFMSLTLVYTSKGAPLNSIYLSLSFSFHSLLFHLSPSKLFFFPSRFRFVGNLRKTVAILTIFLAMISVFIYRWRMTRRSRILWSNHRRFTSVSFENKLFHFFSMIILLLEFTRYSGLLAWILGNFIFSSSLFSSCFFFFFPWNIMFRRTLINFDGEQYFYYFFPHFSVWNDHCFTDIF